MTTQPSRPTLPAAIQQTPGLDAWVRIDETETITIFTGKVEIGQGIKTALAQIVAEELDVAVARIQVAVTTTAQSPNEGYTAGSNSLESSGNALRVAAAEARYRLLELACEALESYPDQVQVSDGVITDQASHQQTSYWDLFGGQKFGADIQGLGKPKSPDQYTVVGQPVPRLDLLALVTGQPHFVHDLDLPDMVHGRIVRPPHYHARLISVETATVLAMPGVISVVQNGSFLGVVAEQEIEAVQAAAALRQQATWTADRLLPASENHPQSLVRHPQAQSRLVVNGTPVTDPIPEIATPSEAAATLSATYHRPYHMHASLGPAAAVAQFMDGKLTVWSHNQGPYPLRASLAPILKMAEEEITVIHREGAGCYGHNGADDAALDAALLAQAVPNRPVSLKWSRSDEHAWEPYGSAMAIELQASLNSAGQIIDWNHDGWSHTHSGRPRPMAEASNMLAAWHLADPWSPPTPQPGSGYHGGIHRNADPLYAFPSRRIVKHLVPDSPLRVSSMRGLGAYANIFAIESFMDELAEQAGVDPVEFRLRHLTDARAQAVIRLAAEKAGWSPDTRPANTGRGRGIAFAQYKNKQCYAAIVVDVSADSATNQIKLERAVIAADAGQVVNPDGLKNQLEGGFIQAASWSLKEAVTWNAQGITSIGWDSYPIFTFADIPPIETYLQHNPDLPFLGSGEATQGPAPAAIANAIYDAVGVRLRQIPFKLP